MNLNGNYEFIQILSWRSARNIFIAISNERCFWLEKCPPSHDCVLNVYVFCHIIEFVLRLINLHSINLFEFATNVNGKGTEVPQKSPLTFCRRLDSVTFSILPDQSLFRWKSIIIQTEKTAKNEDRFEWFVLKEPQIRLLYWEKYLYVFYRHINWVNDFQNVYGCIVIKEH